MKETKIAIIRTKASMEYLHSPRYYSYLSLSNRNVDGILRNKIWLAHPIKFNDPFDSMLRISFPEIDGSVVSALVEYYLDESSRRFGESEISADELKELYWAEGEEPPPFTDMIENVLFDDSKRLEQYQKIHEYLVRKKLSPPMVDLFFRVYMKLGVKCFSRSFYSPQLWSYYAANHSGICVEYDFSELSGKEIVIRDVDYSGKESGVLSFREGVVRNRVLGGILDQISKKSPDWGHELESRLVSFSKSEQQIDAPGRITAVCFGYNANPVDVRLARSMLKNSLPKVELYRSEKNRTELCVDWETLDNRFPLNARSKAEFFEQKTFQ